MKKILLPGEPVKLGFLQANELTDAAGSTPGANEAAPKMASTVQECAVKIMKGNTSFNSKSQRRSRSKGDKKMETMVPKELDSEGQKLLDAWEMFQENAFDRLHYFE